MKVDCAEGEPLGSPRLQEVYGQGYFHGANSGFASEGYGQVHASWKHWMPWIAREVGAGERWLDLGCAYGFLVAEAREAGFHAFGLEASRFAIGQVAEHAPLAAGRVVLAHAERLPFADESFGVVSAFDLLEHLPAPAQLIKEAARILRPGGLLLAATPDPLVFDRSEPTHVAEHVPSWWVRTLESEGFSVSLRFFQAEYNCELIARLGGPAPVVCLDALEEDPLVQASGDPRLRVALRGGFGAREDWGGRIASEGARIHLLNAGLEPLDVTLEIESGSPVAFVVTLDGRIVARSEASASPDERCAKARFFLPAGGHHLRLRIDGGWMRLRTLRCSASRGDAEEFRSTLPFDLYERYTLSAEIVRRIAPEAKSVLDVGGTMGGGDGHLAWTGDFFPDRSTTVVDERAVDLPEHHRIAIREPLPYADGAFDVVTSQDVLEHVPKSERERFLDEMWRVTGRILLLAGPWDTPGVEEADRYLFELIRDRYGYEHSFLAEHLGHGHPDLDATRRFFLERGASVAVVPSGDLATWLMMQTVNAWLSHPEQDLAYVRANQAVNRSQEPAAATGPVYRHLLVIDRSGASHEAALESLFTDATTKHGAARSVLGAFSTSELRAPLDRAMAPVGRLGGWPEVSFLIVSCNGRALLSSCLESLAAVDYPADRMETIVYDNGSTDGTLEWLAVEHPRVRAIGGPRNDGFAAPNNRAARAASAPVLCLVNNDMSFEPGFLRELVQARGSTGAHCVGARVLSADGEAIEFDGGMMNFYGHGAPRRHGEEAALYASEREPFPTLFASGGAMLVDRAVFLDAGGFDESYFAYFEDVDLGWRLWALGESCVMAPAARVRHREHSSEGLLPPGRRLELLERNALLTIAKNYEEGLAERVFRCALALLGERARLAPDRATACRRGLLGALGTLPVAERRRREIALRRRRSDAEIAPLFLEPWRRPIANPAYARRQRELARLFGIVELFGEEEPSREESSECA